MRKLAIPLSLAAIAALGACSPMEPATPAPAPAVVVAPTPAPVVLAPAPGTVVAAPGTVIAAPTTTVVAPTAMLTGYGRVESITPLTTSAAAGSSRPTRRMGLRMDNGTVQYVDTPADLALGDRIQITSDGYIQRQ